MDYRHSQEFSEKMTAIARARDNAAHPWRSRGAMIRDVLGYDPDEQGFSDSYTTETGLLVEESWADNILQGVMR